MNIFKLQAQFEYSKVLRQFPETESFLKEYYFRMLLLICLKRRWVKNVNVHFNSCAIFM